MKGKGFHEDGFILAKYEDGSYEIADKKHIIRLPIGFLEKAIADVNLPAEDSKL